jgi:hypothetical protein
MTEILGPARKTLVYLSSISGGYDQRSPTSVCYLQCACLSLLSLLPSLIYTSIRA